MGTSPSKRVVPSDSVRAKCQLLAINFIKVVSSVGVRLRLSRHYQEQVTKVLPSKATASDGLEGVEAASGGWA